jgi:hypothetical protein
MRAGRREMKADEQAANEKISAMSTILELKGYIDAMLGHSLFSTRNFLMTGNFLDSRRRALC